MPPRLVPELICSDLARSREFYRQILGFGVRYERPREGFTYLERDGAAIMLEQPADRTRMFPRAELLQPYGRGVNFEIDVDDVDEIHEAVRAAGLEVFLPMEERSYSRTKGSIRVRQFAVQDPDGYLLRISQEIDASWAARRVNPGLRQTQPRSDSTNPMRSRRASVHVPRSGHFTDFHSRSVAATQLLSPNQCKSINSRRP